MRRIVPIACSAVIVAASLIAVLTIESTQALANDPNCNPNLVKWYGVFTRDTSVAPLKGGHARIQKASVTPATTQYTGLNVWVYTSSSLGQWAEIDYGKNFGGSSHGPTWAYAYQNSNGYFTGDNLPFNATADNTMHDVTIKNIGSGQWYGYIDGSVAMLGGSLGDNGVYRQDVGIEADSCYDKVASSVFTAVFDNFTAQNWDLSWSPWFSGSTVFNTPVSGGWISYPTSGQGWEN